MTENAFEHYKTGLKDVDKCHWSLFQMLNSIIYTLPQLEMLELAAKLKQMWDIHHLEEEALMDELGYPYATSHKESHLLLTKRFDEFKNKFVNEQKYTNNYFKVDLEILLRDHIDHMDLQYAAWAKKINYLGK